MLPTHNKPKKVRHWVVVFLWTAIGAFLAAFAVQAILTPNNLIDGGVVGLSMIAARLLGSAYFSPVLLLLTAPFVWLAYRFIRKTFVIQMLMAVCLFSAAAFCIELWGIHFSLDALEVIVAGGTILGVGCGLIIRYGGCIDGTEILAIIVNRRFGFTVGQIIMCINILIFTIAGLVYWDLHTALRSMLMFFVASKMMDVVIVGLEEMKSVIIISKTPEKIGQALVHELGIGLTYLHGRGGYSGNNREVLYVIAERLQLADLKEIVHRLDPSAFVAIQNLQETINGRIGARNAALRKRRRALILKPCEEAIPVPQDISQG